MIVIIIVGGLVGFIHQRTTQQNKVVRLGLVGTDSQPVWNNVRQRLKLSMLPSMTTFNPTLL